MAWTDEAREAAAAARAAKSKLSRNAMKVSDRANRGYKDPADTGHVHAEARDLHRAAAEHHRQMGRGSLSRAHLILADFHQDEWDKNLPKLASYKPSERERGPKVVAESLSLESDAMESFCRFLTAYDPYPPVLPQ
jgi:hypothetical protein